MSSSMPASLRRARALANTIAYLGHDDELATPEQAERWLREMGCDATVDDTALERLRQFRTAVRAWVAALADPQPARASALGGVTLGVEVADNAWRLRPLGSGIDAFLGAIAADLVYACAAGVSDRLKLCSHERCAIAFWDTTRNRSARYCNPRTCANTVRQRAYRIRRDDTGSRS
ncbi:CGNR zinc finger domain-containing protein [Nocardia sp. CDC159]|uniref:CGNR zinc finger domain-containing protein n=1 Tax=Nocardia pulmonis TaxID=2951408 RepID=A0A9X2E2P9_9NOCA|nr:MULTISPECIES: CGNR zinc finger domain-containing protein [Nocardia]MCM6772550.1 CGNR zinc finger domain-containing protein [Nocardia pulmonis]MCM6784792.1 CGNR zinc finger domain-containing protein [Nocardia sp. CDC159]